MLGIYYLYFCCRIINLLNYEVVIVDVSSIFLSCGKSFEKEAEQHLDKIIEDTAIDPGSINLSDYEVIRSDDSIYLTSFTMEGKNNMGMYSSSEFGYIYVRSGQERYFLLDKAQKVTRIVDSATKIFNAAKKDSSFIGNWSMIFIFQVELYGRKIEQE